jgi:AraC-like DNA-binding protein
MDPLTDIITLLRPKAVLSKLVSGAGNWSVRYEKFGHPSFALVLNGSCWLAVDGHDPAQIKTGDFVFLPTTPAFTLASDLETKPVFVSPETSPEPLLERRHGEPEGEPSLVLQSGYFLFDPVNAPVLLDRLPALIHIRSSDTGIDGVAQIVGLIEREARGERPGRDLILEKLVEILLLESLRSAETGADMQKGGLLAGLRDPQLAAALRLIHRDVSQRWTVAELGRRAGMSRSSFADRFAKTVGLTPIEYLQQLRMALAKDMLGRARRSLAEVALAVGYDSTSAFSTAFRRVSGISPGAFAQKKSSRQDAGDDRRYQNFDR